MNGPGLRLLIVVAALMALSAAVFSAEQEQQLQHNPFKRPNYLNMTGTSSAESGLHGNVKMDLRATLSAGKDSLVNVGGKFYRIGDDIDGYELLSVEDDKAIFLNAGKSISVKVNRNTVAE